MSSLTFTKRETPNFRLGRRGSLGKIDQIVIHVTEGLAESVYSWFGSARSQASAHYMVLKTGKIDQFVDEKDEAFHAGRILNPTAPLVLERDGVNPNWYSIGIEHEGMGDEELTPEQRVASIDLIRDICKRRKIPMTRRHIVGHKEIFSGKTCPGAINVDLLVQDVAMKSAPVRPDAPKVVWSSFFNDWLIVTRVVSDTEWYFLPFKQIAKHMPVRANTPLSMMPK